MSLQIEKKWIDEAAVDGEKIKILYGQSLKGLDVNGNEVEIIKIDASGDAVVPQGVVASESFVNSEVASEAALRIAGDASTLSSAQSYTDAEVLEEKGLREAEDLLMFKKDGSRTMTGAMNMGSFKIEGLANGSFFGDAINKGQLDALELDLEGQISTLETNLNGQISQLDSDLSLEETARIAADLVLDGKIETEKGRIDAILLASSADTDTFAEIVSLINSVDTENDTAFAGYVVSNNAAVAQVASDLVTEEAARIAGDATTLSSAQSYTDAEVLEEKTRAEAAEGMLGMRVLFLEGKTLSEDLMFEVGVNSVSVNSVTLPHMAAGIYKVCVGRLNVFKNVDYTVGTEMTMVDGISSPKTKLTWIGELAFGGASPMSSGDKIFISYLYNA